MDYMYVCMRPDLTVISHDCVEGLYTPRLYFLHPSRYTHFLALYTFLLGTLMPIFKSGHSQTPHPLLGRPAVIVNSAKERPCRIFELDVVLGGAIPRVGRGSMGEGWTLWRTVESGERRDGLNGVVQQQLLSSRMVIDVASDVHEEPFDKEQYSLAVFVSLPMPTQGLVLRPDRQFVNGLDAAIGRDLSEISVRVGLMDVCFGCEDGRVGCTGDGRDERGVVVHGPDEPFCRIPVATSQFDYRT